jgi:hypothetical protein
MPGNVLDFARQRKPDTKPQWPAPWSSTRFAIHILHRQSRAAGDQGEFHPVIQAQLRANRLAV